MLKEDLEQLVSEIMHQKTERQELELKAAANGCPTRLFPTLSSFSNQDEGGIIIFGIDESSDYEICGVYDPQELQQKVSEQCRQMSPPVRALFTLCEIDSRFVVSAEIPGADLSLRPVFYRGVGRIKGSYIRIGEADELMSEYEVYTYEAYRRRIHDDLRPVEGSRFSFLDAQQVGQYLERVKQERKNLSENINDEEILELMGILNENVPTLAGMMTFARYPQTFFPQLCITAVALPGTEMGFLGEDGERFLDNKRITGGIPYMLEEAVDFVRRNSRVKTIIDERGQRRDREEYPLRAVREAILNALVHRDYSMHTERTPIRIEMYRDRMEITNSGGIYGNIALDSLGRVHPETRNTVLANLLEVLRITENRYSGIPTIEQECRRAELPRPLFSVRHGEFHVLFRNASTDPYGTLKLSGREEALLTFCETPRSRSELIDFTGKSRYYTMSSIVAPLVEEGKLGLTVSEKPQSKYQKYYRKKKR